MRLNASSSLATLWLVTLLTSDLLVRASSFSIINGGDDVPDFDSSLQVSPDPSSLVSPTASASPSLPVIKLERQLSNVTKHSGDSVTLKCEFSSNAETVHPKISWYKNEAPIEADRSKLIIKTSKTSKGTFSSRLIVNRLDVHDTGFYKCEAVNPLTSEITESLGILQVEGSTHNYGSSQTIPQFDPIISEFPGLHTESNEGSISGISSNQGDTGNGDGSNLGHTFDTQGNALNSFALGHGFNPSTFAITGYCEPYKGSVCSQYIKNATIYVTSRQEQSYLESQLTNVLKHVATWRDISPQCHRFAMPLLCFTAFSLCDEYSSESYPRKVCRDECELLQTDICQKEYAIAKGSLIGSSRILPQCESLAAIGSKESTNCIRLGISSVAPIVHEHTCYNGNGVDYRGTESTTVDGLECIPWSGQNFFRPTEHREISGGHNFCRNPGAYNKQPWCYVRDQNELKKQLCQVKECLDHTWMYVVSPAIVASLLFILMIGICCIRARSRNNLTTKVNLAANVTPSHSVTTTAITSGNTYCANAQAVNFALSKRPNVYSSSVELSSLLPKKVTTSKPQEYSLSSVRFLDELGEGDFGKVYRGELASTSSAVVPCVIKTLKVDANSKLRSEFKRQAEVLNSLHHPNVLNLLGVVLRDEPSSMLFESSMSEGDLHEFLIAHSPNVRSMDIPSNNSYSGKKYLDMCDFLHILTQVAAGMEYLSSNNYVHKDLAARNCTVGGHMTVKIGQIALSKDVYACDYYRFHSNSLKGLLPLRWMSPEAIVFAKFTTASDVWSFGVVIWEVLSYGLQPYYGYSNEEVIQMVQSKHLLRCPDNCPSHMFNLMNATWHEEPSKRPSFVDLHTQLRNWKAVYDNPNSNCPLPHSGSGGSGDSSHNSSHCSKSSRSLPPPPLGPLSAKVGGPGGHSRYPQTQPNTPNHSSHYSSQPIKGATSGPLHVSIPSGNSAVPPPPLGPHFTQMNHHHIQQHFANSNSPLTPQPHHINLSQQHFMTNHNSNQVDHHHFSRPSTPNGSAATPGISRSNFRPSGFS